MPLRSRYLPLHFLSSACAAALVASLVSCGSTPLPQYGVIVETGRLRELGVSTRFGIVSVGAEQDRGEVLVTSFYGDGPATEPALIEPVANGLCRVRMEFPTPWCEISSVLPDPGETLVLAGYSSADELWTRDVIVPAVDYASGLLLPTPPDIPEEWILPGVGVFRWEVDRWRLVGLLIGRVEWERQIYLLAQGPLELSRFVVSDHQRHRPPERFYRRDVRPR